MNRDLEKLMEWSKKWLITFNAKKTKCLYVSRSETNVRPRPVMNGTPLEFVSSHRHLGVILNSSGTWDDHVDDLIVKLSKRIGVLRYLKWKLDRRSLRTIYVMYIRSKLDFADVVWDNCAQHLADRLEILQNEAARIVTGLPMCCSLDNLLNECHLDPLIVRRKNRRLVLMFKIFMGISPSYLQILLPEDRMDDVNYGFRDLYRIRPIETVYAPYRKTFLPRTVAQWNTVPSVVKSSSSSVSCFKRKLETRFNVIPLQFEVSRFLGIMHTQLRYDCCRLNAHLYRRRLIDSSMCACGKSSETTRHFFFHCSRYDTHRTNLVIGVNGVISETRLRITASLKLMLFGNVQLTRDQNDRIFKYVQCFIRDTHRFDH